MKALILIGVLALAVLASIGCGSDPTATPRPTPTPMPTPTLTVLENARAVIEGAVSTIREGRIGDLADTAIGVICDVDAGGYAPALTIETVTDSRLVQLAIQGFCNTRGDG